MVTGFAVVLGLPLFRVRLLFPLETFTGEIVLGVTVVITVAGAFVVVVMGDLVGVLRVEGIFVVVLEGNVVGAFVLVGIVIVLGM
jgi:hypothetical protein